MTKLKDLTGMVFGCWTVLSKSELKKENRIWWICKCKCGTIRNVSGKSLRNGYSHSCGCLAKEKAKEINTKHGMRNTRLYSIWRHIKRRCYNKNSTNYKWYGLKGIIICDEWKNNFENFYNWAINNGYSDNLTIDRIDGNGNYEPNNCRWITIQEQQNNKSNNILIEYNNKKLNLTQLSKLTHIPRHIFYKNLKKNLSIYEIINKYKMCYN